jgi:hypothetical protein
VLGDESLALTLSVRWEQARERAEQALSVALEAGAVSAERARRTPAPLRQSLYLDERDLTMPHVRFAHRLLPSAPSERELALVVAYAFDARDAAVNAPG